MFFFLSCEFSFCNLVILFLFFELFCELDFVIYLLFWKFNLCWLSFNFIRVLLMDFFSFFVLVRFKFDLFKVVFFVFSFFLGGLVFCLKKGIFIIVYWSFYWMYINNNWRRLRIIFVFRVFESEKWIKDIIIIFN